MRLSSRMAACPRWDLNPHDLSVTRFAIERVCQFRHGGTLAAGWQELAVGSTHPALDKDLIS